MRSFALQLLLHLSLQLHSPQLVLAEVPTFKQGEIEKYLSVSEDTGSVPADGFDVNFDDGVHVKIGRDLSAKIIDIVLEKCRNKNDTDCTTETEKALGVGASSNGLQRRFILVGIVGVVLGFVCAKIVSGAWDKFDSERNRYKAKPPNIALDYSKDDTDAIDNATLDEQKFNYEYPDGTVEEVPIDTSLPEEAEDSDIIGISEVKNGTQISVIWPSDMTTSVTDITNDVFDDKDSQCSKSKPWEKRQTNGKNKKSCGPWKTIIEVGIQLMHEAGPGGRLQRLQGQILDLGLAVPPGPTQLVYELRKDERTEKWSFAYSFENDEKRKMIKELMINISAWVAILTAAARELITLGAGLVDGAFFGGDGNMRLAPELATQFDALTKDDLPDMPARECPLWKDKPFIHCSRCGGNMVPFLMEYFIGYCVGKYDKFAYCSCEPDPPNPELPSIIFKKEVADEKVKCAPKKRRDLKRQDGEETPFDPNVEIPDFDCKPEDLGSSPKDEELNPKKDTDEKKCYKNDEYLKDIRNWKFVDEPTLAKNIIEFCEDLTDTKKAKEDQMEYTKKFDNKVDEVPTGQMMPEKRSYWNAVTLKIKREKAGSKWNVPNCKEDMKFLSDTCDYDEVKNQYNWKWGGEYQKGEIHYTIKPEEERAWTSNDKNGLFSSQRFREVKSRVDEMDDSKDKNPNLKIAVWEDDHWVYKPEKEQRKGKDGKLLDMVILHQCLAKMATLKKWKDKLDCAGLVVFTADNAGDYKDIAQCWRKTWQQVSMCLLREGAMSVYGNQQPFPRAPVSRCWVGIEEYKLPEAAA